METKTQRLTGALYSSQWVPIKGRLTAGVEGRILARKGTCQETVARFQTLGNEGLPVDHFKLLIACELLNRIFLGKFSLLTVNYTSGAPLMS